MDFKIEIAKLLAAAAEISVEDAAAAVEIPVFVWRRYSARHPR